LLKKIVYFDSMELKTALKTRRSVRSFTNKPIPEELLQEILDLANSAPSAGNVQAREFIVVKDRRVKEKLTAAALNQRFIYEAPVDIVVCGNHKRSSATYGNRGRSLYSIQDADAAIMHILLAAHASGLGTCWVGAFDDQKVSSILNLPDHIKPIAIIPMGYPAKTPHQSSRIPIQELIHFDKW
jgi:nitroreductase